jgi:hypothetical protein
MSMPEHTVMSDSSERHDEMYDGIQRVMGFKGVY